jgi:hypothetical protein
MAMIGSGGGDQIAGVSLPDEFCWVLRTAALLPRMKYPRHDSFDHFAL